MSAGPSFATRSSSWSAGLLEVRRGIGIRVRDRSRWGFLDDDVLAWHQSAPASPDFLRQLLDVRLMIEPKAARWAAERGSSLQLDAIMEAGGRMARETSSVEEFVFADAAFHRAVLQAANNEILRSFEGAIISALLGSIRLTNRDPRENEESIPLHRAVADEIISAAEKKMEVLLSDVRGKLEIRIDNASGMKPPLRTLCLRGSEPALHYAFRASDTAPTIASPSA